MTERYGRDYSGRENFSRSSGQQRDEAGLRRLQQDRDERGYGGEPRSSERWESRDDDRVGGEGSFDRDYGGGGRELGGSAGGGYGYGSPGRNHEDYFPHDPNHNAGQYPGGDYSGRQYPRSQYAGNQQGRVRYTGEPSVDRARHGGNERPYQGGYQPGTQRHDWQSQGAGQYNYPSYQERGREGGRFSNLNQQSSWEDRNAWGERDSGYSPSNSFLRSREQESSGMVARRQGGFYGKGPKGYTRSDDRIREDVSDRLSEDDELDASEISVTVSAGEVTLEGQVPDRRSKHRAEDICDSIAGVRDVHNHLRSRKGFVQEVGDRLLGRDDEVEHGHSGSGTRNTPATGAASPGAAARSASGTMSSSTSSGSRNGS
jgi:hypothetical protein